MELDFNDIVAEQFAFVKALVHKNNKNIIVVRHILSGEKYVRIDTAQSVEIYDVLKKISCPNLPVVYGVFNIPDGYSVIEEYIDGLTLAQMINEALYDEAGVKAVVKGVCNALNVLHSMGIIYRDIKPENIMVDKSGTVKLIDFDAARFFKSYKTQDTQFIGTTGFAAPEQYGINQSDERTDIFAVGVLMNVMLTGEHPSKKMYNGKMSRIIEKCINLDPDKRYSSVKQLFSKLN